MCSIDPSRLDPHAFLTQIDRDSSSGENATIPDRNLVIGAVAQMVFQAQEKLTENLDTELINRVLGRVEQKYEPGFFDRIVRYFSFSDELLSLHLSSDHLRTIESHIKTKKLALDSLIGSGHLNWIHHAVSGIANNEMVELSKSDKKRKSDDSQKILIRLASSWEHIAFSRIINSAKHNSHLSPEVDATIKKLEKAHEYTTLPETLQASKIGEDAKKLKHGEELIFPGGFDRHAVLYSIRKIEEGEPPQYEVLQHNTGGGARSNQMTRGPDGKSAVYPLSKIINSEEELTSFIREANRIKFCDEDTFKNFSSSFTPCKRCIPYNEQRTGTCTHECVMAWIRHTTSDETLHTIRRLELEAASSAVQEAVSAVFSFSSIEEPTPESTSATSTASSVEERDASAPSRGSAIEQFHHSVQPMSDTNSNMTPTARTIQDLANRHLRIAQSMRTTINILSQLSEPRLTSARLREIFNERKNNPEIIKKIVSHKNCDDNLLRDIIDSAKNMAEAKTTSAEDKIAFQNLLSFIEIFKKLKRLTKFYNCSAFQTTPDPMQPSHSPQIAFVFKSEENMELFIDTYNLRGKERCSVVTQSKTVTFSDPHILEISPSTSYILKNITTSLPKLGQPPPDIAQVITH
jgi:hypothetical protein